MLNIDPTQIEGEGTYSILSFKNVVIILSGISVGIMLAIAILPIVLPGFAASLSGTDPKGFWFLARGSAIAAYITLWLSMVLGLGMTTKSARWWPANAAAYDLHQFISLMGIGLAVFHALILLGDHYIGFNLLNLIIPFSNNVYRPFWVGIGQISLYLWLIIALSFYFKRWIKTRVWRYIHYSGFLLYIVALFHGIMSGTDSHQLWAGLLYWSSGGILLTMFVFRILLKVLPNKQSGFQTRKDLNIVHNS